MTSRNGRRVVSESRTVLDNDFNNLRMIRLHCDYLRRTGARPRTIEHRQANLRRLAERLPCSLLDATRDDLDAWQSRLQISNSSIATYTNHTVAFYKWAVEAGHLEIDPSAQLPRPKLPRRTARPIPDADLKIALTCAPPMIRIWLILAAFMGLRAMEVAGMSREDLTEENGRLFLSGIGKGGKEFTLPVPVEVEPTLREHLTVARGPLWRLPSGQPVKASYLTIQVGRFFRSIGMPYTLHWCRHRFGTMSYRQTRDLLLTQKLLRHENPATTQIYIETTRAEVTAAMDRLSASLRKKDTTRRRKPTRNVLDEQHKEAS